MHIDRRFARLALLLGLMLPLACVNPFKPANPEPPAPGGVPEFFSSPELVLDTMDRAIESKSSGGADAWLHAFAQSTQAGDRAFRAFYDDAVKRSWEDKEGPAPEPWDVTLERGLPSKLFSISPNASYTFKWAGDPSAESDGVPGGSPDTVQFHRMYTLSATSANSSKPETIAIGFCDLSFQNTNGRWSIFRWNDRVDPAVGVTPGNPSTNQRTMTWWRLESRKRQ